MIRALRLSVLSIVASAVAGCACPGVKNADTVPGPAPVVTEPVKQPEPLPEPVVERKVDPEPVLPPPVTSAEVAKLWLQCVDAISNSNSAGILGCYDENATYEQADGDTKLTGAAALAQMYQGYDAAFSDLTVSPVVVLVNGKQGASVHLVAGTHSGELFGMPASKKKIGMLIASRFEFSDAGRVVSEREWIDFSTLMGQLGAHKNPHRPALAKAPPQLVVVADGSAAEEANAQALRGLAEVFNRKDWMAFEAGLADDAVYSEALLPADVKGKKDILKHFKELTTAFPDAQVAIEGVWGAGDWVVATAAFTGTNQGASKAFGIKKKTGKSVTLSSLHLFQFADGKVKQHWTFDNGMALATQLGLASPSK